MLSSEFLLNVFYVVFLSTIFLYKLWMIGLEKVWSTDSILHHFVFAFLSASFIMLSRAILKDFTLEPPTWFSPVFATMGESLLKQKMEPVQTLSDYDEIEEEIDDLGHLEPRDVKSSQSPRRGNSKVQDFDRGGLQQRKVVRSEEFPTLSKPKLVVSKSLPKDLEGDKGELRLKKEENGTMARVNVSAETYPPHPSKESPKSLDSCELERNLKPNFESENSRMEAGTLHQTSAGKTDESGWDKDRRAKKKKQRNVSNLDSVVRHRNAGDSLPPSSPTSPASVGSPILPLSPRFSPSLQSRQSQAQKDHQKLRKDAHLSVDSDSFKLSGIKAGRTSLGGSQLPRPKTEGKASSAAAKAAQSRSPGIELGSSSTKLFQKGKGKEVAPRAAVIDDFSLSKSPNKPASAWGSGVNAWQTGGKLLAAEGSASLVPGVPAGGLPTESPWTQAGSDLMWSMGILEEPPLIDVSRPRAESLFPSASGLQKLPSYTDMAMDPLLPLLPPRLPLSVQDASEVGLLASPNRSRASSPFEVVGGFPGEMNLDSIWARQQGLEDTPALSHLPLNGLNFPLPASSQGTFPLLTQSGTPPLPLTAPLNDFFIPEDVALGSAGFPGFNIVPEPLTTLDSVGQLGGIYGFSGLGVSSLLVGNEELLQPLSEPAESGEVDKAITDVVLDSLEGSVEVKKEDRAKGTTKVKRGSFWSNNDPQEAFLASSLATEKYFDDSELK